MLALGVLSGTLLGPGEALLGPGLLAAPGGALGGSLPNIIIMGSIWRSEIAVSSLRLLKSKWSLSNRSAHINEEFQ